MQDAIKQGNLYWLRPTDAHLHTPTIAHPHVIIQDNALNQNPMIETVVVCALTTNAKKITMPGNVLLLAGEGNLPRASTVEVSKQHIIKKTDLGDPIGALSAQRIQQILAGIAFVQRAFLDHDNDATPE